MRRSSMAGALAFLVIVVVAPAAARNLEKPLPPPKRWMPGTGRLSLAGATVSTSAHDLANEVGILREQLGPLPLTTGDSGPPIRLEIAPVDLPPISSAYAADLRRQAYRVNVNERGVRVQAADRVGVMYGIQTVTQLIDDEGKLPFVEIIDWPDLAFRGVMIDPARANENAAYYERLIRFCGRYKINRIHVHLSDDQNVCLFHEDYRLLMHPHAWTTDRLDELVRLARRYHIELIPEIESLGHARVFLRHPEFKEFLHQTTKEPRGGRWVGTDVSGYTNVLCPASAKAIRYLERMYGRAATSFPFPEIHVGCDEVDMTTCARCEAASPGVSHAEWFARHVLRCRDIAARHGRRIALWGDMLLSHPQIADRLPADDLVVYDWHYRADVSAESVSFLASKGFEVIGCPALMCYPRMILPSVDNYTNIRRFAEVARAEDILGLDTTIWIPTRYMSDVLWPGIAYAAAHAWGGSQWDEGAFYRRFVAEFFGSSEGDAFAPAWDALSRIDWPLRQFRICCWFDDASLSAAQRQADGELGARARRNLKSLKEIRDSLSRVRGTVCRNRKVFIAIERSAAVLGYTLEHLLAGGVIRREGVLNGEHLRTLDRGCVDAIGWIEEDWNRNRYLDDPFKADLAHTDQHLLHRFRQMHAYHEQLISRARSLTPP